MRSAMNRRLATGLWVAIAVCSPSLVRAQGGAPAIADRVLARMWTLGMDSSHVWDLSQALFDSIGPRLTGTPQGNQASDWVIAKYKAWGIDGRREQYGTW